MLSNFDESEEELNLDLPPVLSGKKNISTRICESSEAEQERESDSDSSDASDSNSDSNSPDVSDAIVDSDLENSIISTSQVTKKSKKSSKKKQFLSRDYIDNSDFDDNPLTLEELARMTQKSESEDEGDSFEVDEYGEMIRKPRRMNKKKEEFVKASEDFKSRLKLMPYDDSETEDSEREFDTDSSEIDDADSEDNSKPVKVVRVKKPKETLKKVLKESEALLRRSIPVDLEIEVPKPKTLDLILNEALAANSRTPAEAKKRVIDEKRRMQRMKLEKILGPERMASLIKDEPKIGHSKLDEAIEIEVETVDEKAAEGEEIAKEIFKVKLTDLPDKHFDGGKRTNKSADTAAGYKAYINSQKKASIELLNIQLQEKIRAQSNAALLHHQRAQAAHLAARRAKAEERERKRKETELRKERELREKREKKVGGGELFKKEKYEGIERPADMDNSDDVRGYDEIFETRKPTARIILSEDEEEEEGDIEYLLNLDHEEDEGSETAESECLPDIDEAMGERVKENSEGLDALLSGKFAEGHSDLSEADSETTVLSSSKHKHKLQSVITPRIKSMFIDDEASDENEEKDNDEIDEDALQEEMQKSNFIAESGDEIDVDPAELRAFANKKSIQEDEEINQKLMGLLGRHLDEEGDEFFNSLGNKYGLNEESDNSKKRSLVSQTSLDEDIRKLLDPIEQKKRKLAALGSLNILNRQRQIEAASEEFQFVKRTGAGVSDCSSDYYATTDESDSDDSEGYGGGYYEEVESGLQSRVEEMLDEEMLDGEEVQVQATESLSIHLQTILKGNEPINSQNTKDSSQNIAFSSQNIAVNSQTIKSTVKGRGVAVPAADAKLKSRLLALQQENDEIAGGNSNGNEKFKGFSISKK